jgi:hypothetical protein
MYILILILFQGEAFGFLTHASDYASAKTYSRLKQNAENCRHPKKDTGANGSGVAEKTTLILIVILTCLLF